MENTFKRLVIDTETNECSLDGINLNKEPITYLKLEYMNGRFELHLEMNIKQEKKNSLES